MNNITCLCNHRKRRLAAASAVLRHDTERVLSVRCEGLDLSGGGGHYFFSEEAIGVLDSYDVLSRPGLQGEPRNQSRAVLLLHCHYGIHRLRC